MMNTRKLSLLTMLGFLWSTQSNAMMTENTSISDLSEETLRIANNIFSVDSYD